MARLDKIEKKLVDLSRRLSVNDGDQNEVEERVSEFAVKDMAKQRKQAWGKVEEHINSSYE